MSFFHIRLLTQARTCIETQTHYSFQVYQGDTKPILFAHMIIKLNMSQAGGG